jgi:SPP1 gp7 family putative phage head morphogenesis protein
MTGGWSFYLPIMQQATGGLSASERAKMFKMIEEDSRKNEKIIIEAKAPKQYDFKGRFLFQQKMKICEYIAKKNTSPRTKSKNKKAISMLEDEKIKEMYADMINKKIDAKADKLTPDMSLFAMKQKARVVSALMKQKKALKNKFKISTIFKEKEEVALTIDFIIPYIEEFLAEAGKESLLQISPQEVFSTDAERIAKFIDDRSKMFGKSVTKTTLQGLERTLSEGIAEGEAMTSLVERVNEVYDEFPSYRSELIARTEATAANNEGILESFKQSGVVNAKEWITAGDDRVRPEHSALDGEIVLNEENFSNGLPYPEEPNCRCVLGGAFIE